MKLPKKDVNQFIQEGGTAPTKVAAPAPATPPADEKEMSGFSLRLYTSKLRELTDIRDARRTEAKANKQPNASAISVHSLILEGIDLLLKQEAKRTKGSTTGSTTKRTARKTDGDTK